MPATPTSRGAAPRTLDLLLCIASGEREFALKDVADKTGLAASTVHRLLEFWVQRDLLERAGPKAYRMGPELFRLAALVSQRFELAVVARPLLLELWTKWQETTSLCLYNRSSYTATVAESLGSPHPITYHLAPHSKISLAWGSLGRAILAHLPAHDVDLVIMRDRGGPISGRSLPARKVLEKELSLIRKRHCAIYEDSVLSIAGVSAPLIQGKLGVVGSLGVIMPGSRFAKHVKSRLPESVITCAANLSATLGSR